MSPIVFLACFISTMIVYSPPYILEQYTNSLLITSNPDSYLSPRQMIKRHGYPAQTHTILTDDGYLLGVHRIPYGKNGTKNGTREPVLLNHAFMSSSLQWIIAGPENSLGYQLADQGYDVWMMNLRGNTFSEGHITYNPAQKEFWNFSVHHFGVHDVPAVIDHILDKTGHQQLIYIAHSEGTAAFYITASMLPQYNDKVKMQISMAPISKQSHSIFPPNFLVPFLNHVGHFILNICNGSNSKHDVIIKLIEQLMSLISLRGMNLATWLLMITRCLNYDPNKINKEILKIAPSVYPMGSSLKATLHGMQFVASFANFDYGEKGNMIEYGSPKPPEYNISAMTVPTRIYYGRNDPIANPMDSIRLYDKLPRKAGLIKVHEPGFSHLDFFFAKYINELVNNDVIQFLEQATNSTNSTNSTSLNP